MRLNQTKPVVQKAPTDQPAQTCDAPLETQLNYCISVQQFGDDQNVLRWDTIEQGIGAPLKLWEKLIHNKKV